MSRRHQDERPGPRHKPRYGPAQDYRSAATPAGTTPAGTTPARDVSPPPPDPTAHEIEAASEAAEGPGPAGQPPVGQTAAGAAGADLLAGIPPPPAPLPFVRVSSSVRILPPGSQPPSPAPSRPSAPTTLKAAGARHGVLPSIPPPRRESSPPRPGVPSDQPVVVPPPPEGPPVEPPRRPVSPPPPLRPPAGRTRPTGPAPRPATPAPRPAPAPAQPQLSRSPPHPRPRPAPPPGRPASPRPAPPAPEAPPPRPVPGSFSRSTSLMALGTGLSRLSGFAKVLALAWVLGVNRLADSYNLANNMPNSIYDLVLGGVLSATLIPVFVDEVATGRSRSEASRSISAVVTVVAATLVVLTVVFWFAAPAVIDLLLVRAHGGAAGAERRLATHLLRLFVPQLFLLGGIAMTTAILNARRRFATPAFSPVLCNVVTVAAVIATGALAPSLDLTTFERDQGAILVLGLGTTAGYLVQLAAQLPALSGTGIRLRPVWDPRHRAVRTVLALSGWTAGSVLANQVSFYVVQLLAGARGGDVTAFNYAYQFFQLPYAIFAVSIASVISPDLAERWSAGAMRAYRARLGSGIRLTLAILVPAGAGYAVIAGPLLHLALDHGRVSGPEAHLTAVLLAIFALGLPGFSVYLLLMRAYQSMKDTRAMFWRYCAENALTLVAAAALYPALGVRGLALGWIGAYSVVAVTAFAQVARRTGGLQGEALRATAWRVAVASAAMVAALEGLGAVLPGSAGVAVTVVKVCLLAVVGTAVYVLVALWLGVAEVRRVLLVRWSGR